MDIVLCYLKYGIWSNQYRKAEVFKLAGDEKVLTCRSYGIKNHNHDRWVKSFFDNYRFLRKWSDFKYEMSPALQRKRRDAYKKYYGLGENCFIGYDVVFHRHHFIDGQISTGENCHFAEHTNIDITGGLTLGNKCSLSEGVKILTHNHVMDFSGVNEDKGCIISPLIIEDRVWVGTRAMIMPGVNRIGRGAMISSGSLVRSEVPPYAIVMGNPAKIVGFRMSPKEIVAFEEANYPETERIPTEILNKNYDIYYVSRWREIKEFIRAKV